MESWKSQWMFFLSELRLRTCNSLFIFMSWVPFISVMKLLYWERKIRCISLYCKDFFLIKNFVFFFIVTMLWGFFVVVFIVSILLFEDQSERQREKPSICWFRPPNACASQDWALPKSGTWPPRGSPRSAARGSPRSAAGTELLECHLLLPEWNSNPSTPILL